MSNASLKEQLQTLGLSTANEKPQQSISKRPTKKEKPQEKKAAAKPLKPAWLEQAQYGVELLKAYFPGCFKEMKEIQPLKKGIKQDLVKFLSTQENIVLSDKACMVNSLAYYVNSPAYHKQVVEGAMRIGLEGESDGVVTTEEATYSVECRQAKLEKKKKTPSSNVEVPATQEK